MLGIEPTGDRGAIRRAYAGRLKRIDSGSDPEGFRQLRAAYEEALQGAVTATPADRGPPAVVIEVEKALILPAKGASAPPRPKGSGAKLVSAARIRALMGEGEPLAAAAVWLRATDLSFLEMQSLSNALAGMAAEPAMDLGTVEALVDAMGWREVASWQKAGTPPGSVAVEAVFQRLLAEGWYAGLVATAALPVRSPGRWKSRVVAARLVLRGAPVGLERLLALPLAAGGLGYWMPGVRRHWRWIAWRLDGKRVSWCETALKRSQGWLVKALYRAVWLFVVSNVVVMAVGIIKGLMLAFE